MSDGRTIKHDVRYPLFFIQQRLDKWAVVAARYSEHGFPIGAKTVAFCDTHEEATAALDEARKAAKGGTP
jgi:hypothetical protein